MSQHEESKKYGQLKYLLGKPQASAHSILPQNIEYAWAAGIVLPMLQNFYPKVPLLQILKCVR
jgi:uncharacterized protein (DUF433 family)